jgi:DNA helicase-2/ATP-dependent DNA helicase PcrA
MDTIRDAGRIAIPDAIERRERELEGRPQPPSEGVEPDLVERLRKLRSVPYSQLRALAKFINEQTPFSTKHGVKGAEFENVLVVLGRGWNQYNFNSFLEMAGEISVPPGRMDMYERNRNLFYVVCSRPKRRLALFFTQRLSTRALATLSQWFGADMIHVL